MTIFFGIICLGVIIFIHECGHFIAARVFGVDVEAFSIGMGPVLFHKKIDKTDYRLSIFPLGGYCAMKGEKDFQRAIDLKMSNIPTETGSFYGVHPFKRVLIAFAGPFSNLIFSVIAFFIISMIGFTYYSADNRIIPANLLYDDVSSVAYDAGLISGDKIISMNGKKITNFAEISEYVSTHPNENIITIVDRAGNNFSVNLVPTLDKTTGAGKIGIINWIDLDVFQVENGSNAFLAGFLKGDKIISIDNVPVNNSVEMQLSLENKSNVDINILRDGHILSLNLEIPNNSSSIGLDFAVPKIISQRLSFFESIESGLNKTFDMFTLTIKSLKLLFSGVDIKNAVSGPVRITVLLGDTVQSGFGQSFSIGITSVLNLLALISISLFIMNLLPIPVLDGGLILFAFIEIITKKQVSPKNLYIFQIIGIVIICILFFIALFSDITFLWQK